MKWIQVSAQNRTGILNIRETKPDYLQFSLGPVESKNYLGKDALKSVDYSNLMLMREACPEGT